MLPKNAVRKLVVGLYLAASMLVVHTKHAYAESPLLQAPLAEYIHVPGGRLVHQSCVQYFPAKPGVQAKIDAVNNNFLENGSVVAHLGPCAYEERHVEASINGWLQSVIQNHTSGGGYGFLENTVTVPGLLPCYPNCSNAVDFFWNGLQSSFNNQPLIQPVLQWGIASPSNGNFGSDTSWGMASWYCNGSCVAYGYQKVSPGAQINLVAELDYAPTGEWAIGWSEPNSPYENGEILETFGAGSSFTSADIAIAEVYNINYCNQMPGAVVFQYTTMYDASDNPISFLPTVTPASCSCGCGIYAPNDTYIELTQ
jgi:hypothetical protein